MSARLPTSAAAFPPSVLHGDGRARRAEPVQPELLTSLLTRGPAVLPSLLQCDFGYLHDEVEKLQTAGASGLHLDVMDGRFVPQLTYGPVVVEAVCRSARVPVDAHLMIEDPLATLDAYVTAGVEIITLHVETLENPKAALAVLREAGVIGQLAISPQTPAEALAPLLSGDDRELCDGVLVMSVDPGFGGQAFQKPALDKLRYLASFRHDRGRPLRLGVDGGVSTETIGLAASAGAELIVAGSAILRAKDYAQAIQVLEHNARETV